jgi:putative SOS response-associated peptidase YedK
MKGLGTVEECAEPIESSTMITGPPNSLTADLHDRMPVILEPGSQRERLVTARY